MMRIFKGIIGIAAVIAVLGSGQKSSASEVTDELLAAAYDTTKSFLEDQRWAIAKNGLGGARGLLIVPTINKGGFIFGFERGVGLLMSRRGKEWSEPVFLAITNSSIGFQAGAQQSKMLMLMMADEDMEKLADQSIGLGTAGGLTIGQLGAGVGAAASYNEGVNILFAYEADGIFAGGSFSNTAMSIDDDLNKDRYNMTGSKVLALLKQPGMSADTAKLRALLTDAVEDAWKGSSWD